MVRIILEGDGALKDYKVLCDERTLIAIGLPEGMASGRPSVALAIEVHPGEVALVQLSMREFLSVARAFQTKYEDVL